MKVYDLGKRKWIDKYYPGNYGAPGRPRNKKRKKTPEDIARVNQRNKEKKVQLLILANFKEGDWHLILTYKKEERPPDMDHAKKDISEFMDGMRRECKKLGIPFKWIRVTEVGKRGGCHHHLVIENFPGVVKLVQKYWTHGRTHFTPLYEDGEFEDLAEYLVKKETKEEWTGCSYSRSRNLVIPEPEKEIVYRKRWKKEPQPPKGWRLVPNTLVNGINPVTEYPYQHYMIEQLCDSG
ncbi:MAG: hypothetical protein LUH07_07445 [Lachnospiraceae bacterium]|nr:hypothetical protein [Lachnospiraceae bacterium]